jgi:TetR/AcrR family transcriptional repressor of nem operon
METEMTRARPTDSRHRLLSAALRVVRVSGYAGSSVDDICRAADVTKGSFFHHFKSKDDLALAAIAHWEVLTESLFAAAAYRALPDPLDRVLGYVALRGELLRGDIPDVTCFLGTLVQETHATHPALREACERSLRAHVDALTSDIKAARSRYAPDAAWTAQSVAVYIQSVLQGAFIFAKAQQDTAVVVSDLEHLSRHLHCLFNCTHPPRRPI